MKLGRAEVPRWLARPLSARGVLVHGEDRGGVSEIANQVAQKLSPDLTDPFRVTVLEVDALKGDPARLNDELGMLCALGGGRLVRLQGATDRQTALIQDGVLGPALSPGNLLLVEAGELQFRSSLRKLFESHAALVAIQCGVEAGVDREKFVRDILTAEGLRIGEEALSTLLRRLGPDRAMTRRALEVLALYKNADGPGAEVSPSDVLAVVGDAELLELEDVMAALLAHDPVRLDRALSKAMAAGVTPVAIVRSALRNFQRLHLVVSVVEGGGTAEAALARLVPPIHFSARASFLAASRRWRRTTLEQVMEILNAAEGRCKTTGLPEAVICAETLLALVSPAGPAARPPAAVRVRSV